ncbi:hypothetical protein O3G_MSEX010561 [Manduca sexta]|uniref:Uncharacterized protein n=1 Tax=Manduca sexta TaxID=7130 RepID=A0A921ZI49_MANSE|nr:hypothetical protein O3G_MSEX010561 [Manduca sexta]
MKVRTGRRAARFGVDRADLFGGAARCAGTGCIPINHRRSPIRKNDDEMNNHYSLHFINDLLQRYCIFPLVVINPTREEMYCAFRSVWTAQFHLTPRSICSILSDNLCILSFTMSTWDIKR